MVERTGTSTKKKEYSFKILMLGDSGAGKTSLLLRFSQDDFTPSYITTIGVDIINKKINIGNYDVALKVWDTAGQERYQTFTKQFFQNVDGVVLVLDLLSLESFGKLEKWLDLIRNEDQNKKQNLINNNIHQNEQMEEYFPFGKNDINYNRRRRVDVNNTNDSSHPFNQQEQVRKAYEAQKLQREMEEKLKREEENEEFKREQKRKMINEFKSGLDQQISEKNNLKTKAMNDGKLNDFNEIQRLNKEVMEEQLNNERIKLDKQNQYKQILNEQVRQNKKQYQYEYE